MNTFPEPDLLSCYFDEAFTPHLAAMRLRWPQAAEDRLWRLPQGVCLSGPPPERLGVNLQRLAPNTYALCLVWDEKGFRWASLTAAELITGDLCVLLEAIGTDLRGWLTQPVSTTAHSLAQAA